MDFGWTSSYELEYSRIPVKKLREEVNMTRENTSPYTSITAHQMFDKLPERTENRLYECHVIWVSSPASDLKSTWTMKRAQVYRAKGPLDYNLNCISSISENPQRMIEKASSN
ncbi:hypothetical protein C5167_007828 [Papaver somniferum]|nr:hypothetical protein C5167_007828 [Papaver somniferum]